MHFKTAKKRRIKQDTPLAACSLCAQDIYFGERAWCCNGLSVCSGCFDTFAQSALKPFETILGEEMEE